MLFSLYSIVSEIQGSCTILSGMHCSSPLRQEGLTCKVMNVKQTLATSNINTLYSTKFQDVFLMRM